ncbi:MAG: flagellar biosynthesis anti-sigma factor FlgM [Methylovulum sp.]|nr:flagellar biosynthesis anti-sigma factor FlgM [Methylovulum sp.]
MTIESITGRPQMPVTVKIGSKAETDGEKGMPVKSTETTDSIDITKMAQGIKKAFESSSTASSVDLDRVRAVKKALADGSYPINAERIAKKMIQFEKSMP